MILGWAGKILKFQDFLYEKSLNRENPGPVNPFYSPSIYAEMVYVVSDAAICS